MRVRCVFAVCSVAWKTQTSRGSAEEMLLYIHSNPCFCQPPFERQRNHICLNPVKYVTKRLLAEGTANCGRLLVVGIFFPALGPTHRGLNCWTWVIDDPHVCVGRRIWLGRLWSNLYLRLLSGGLGLSGRLYCYKPTLDPFSPRWSADWFRKRELERPFACIRWWVLRRAAQADSFQLWPGSTTQVWEKRRQNNESYNCRRKTTRLPKQDTLEVS